MMPHPNVPASYHLCTKSKVMSGGGRMGLPSHMCQSCEPYLISKPVLINITQNSSNRGSQNKEEEHEDEHENEICGQPSRHKHKYGMSSSLPKLSFPISIRSARPNCVMHRTERKIIYIPDTRAPAIRVGLNPTPKQSRQRRGRKKMNMKMCLGCEIKIIIGYATTM